MSAKVSFREEFARCWGLLENKALFFILLGMWLALFQFLGNSTFGYIRSPSLFAWTYDTASGAQSEDGNVLLMPFAILGLFWWKRNQLLSVRRSPWAPGLILLAAAMVLHVAGHLIQQPRVSLVACCLGIVALIGLTWGWEFLKASFFPCCLFIFCIPVANLGVLEKVTVPLRTIATVLTFHLCDFLGFGLIRHGTGLFDPTGRYSYEVAAACSGIRSLIPLIALTWIYGVIAFNSWSRRILLVVAAVPLTVFCNVLRLAAIVIAGDTFGQQAGHFVHEWFGFVTYGVALAFVYGFERIWPEPDEQLSKAKELR